MNGPRQTSARRLAALLVLAFVAAYTVAVVSGTVHKDNRLQLADLALIVLASTGVGLLLNPTLMSRLRTFELQGFKVELLEQVRDRQLQQAQDLADLQLILPLLLPETERTHLKNLAEGTADGYKGNHALRTELRRLRSIGLIRTRSNRAVGHIVDGLVFDLGDYVALTELGERWTRRLAELDEAPGPLNGATGVGPPGGGSRM